MKQKEILLYLPALLVMLFLAWWYGDGRDHYQLLYALQAELAGSSAYSDATFQRIADTYSASGPHQCLTCADAGFGYPLTAIWITLPLVWLPELWWATAWEAVTIVLMLTAIMLLRLSPLWIFCTFFRNATLSNNVNSILIALTLIAVWAIRERRYALASLLAVLLLATKPQTVGVFALALAWQIWQQRQWQWLVGFSILIGGATFAVQPDWIILWLQSLGRFASVVPTVTHAFWALPLATVAFWRHWHWTALALIQISLPVTTMPYTLLPLMLAGLDFSRERQTYGLILPVIFSYTFIAPVRLLGIVVAASFLGFIFLLPSEQPRAEPSPTTTPA